MKILSVDFNIVMHNYIKLYADKVDIKENPTLIWEMLENEMEIKQHLGIDAKVLKKIVALFKLNHCTHFYFLDNQKDIVNDINNLKKEYDEIELTNIDFFHDLIYTNEDIINWKKDKYDDSNWLGYLLYKDEIDKCQWIKMPNSYRCNNNVEDDVEIINFSNININDFSDFDIIYFSFSPCYVPYEYKYIYDIICDFLKEEDDE